MKPKIPGENPITAPTTPAQTQQVAASALLDRGFFEFSQFKAIDIYQ